MKDYFGKFLILFITGIVIALSLAFVTCERKFELPYTDPYVSIEEEVVSEPSHIPSAYRDLVVKTAEKAGVPLHVLHSVIAAESAYNPKVNGRTNSDGTYDIGLMQLNSRYLDGFIEKYWKSSEKFDVYNAAHNMFIGASILADLKKRLGTWEWAVKAYNTGAGSVLRGERTQAANKYYDKIIDHYVAMRRSK